MSDKRSNSVSTDTEFGKDAARIEKYLAKGDASLAYIDRMIELLDADANTARRKNVVRRLRQLSESKGKLRKS